MFTASVLLSLFIELYLLIEFYKDYNTELKLIKSWHYGLLGKVTTSLARDSQSKLSCGD